MQQKKKLSFSSKCQHCPVDSATGTGSTMTQQTQPLQPGTPDIESVLLQAAERKNRNKGL